VLSGNIGIGLLFAMPCFTGFEATVIFAMRSKDPDKTILRATLGFIVVMGATYALSVWVIIQAIGRRTPGPRPEPTRPERCWRRCKSSPEPRSWTS